MHSEYNRFMNRSGSKKTDFNKAGEKVRYYKMPFDAGVWMCPGRFFAINELRQFILLMLVFFEFELKNPDEKIPDTVINQLGFGAIYPIRDIKFHYKLRTHDHNMFHISEKRFSDFEFLCKI